MQEFDFSDPGSTEASQTAHSRRMAEAMMAQATMGNQPAYSGRAALARALMGGLAGFELGGVQQRETALAEKTKAERAAEMTRLADAMETPEGSPERSKLARLLIQSSNPNAAKAGLALLTKVPKEEEAYTLKPGEARYKGNAVVAERPAAPEKEPDSVRALKAEMKAAGIDPESQVGKEIFAAAVKKQTTHQPATSVSVNTDKGYSGEIAKGLAKQDLDSIDAGRSAPSRVENARRIRDVLDKNPITGTGADIRLGISKAFATAGLIDGSTVKSTEDLASLLASGTLDAIKSSGLGSGQGFTDKDRQFLEKAKSGNIEINAGTLRMLADLNERAAMASIDRANKVIRKLKGNTSMGGVGSSLEEIQFGGVQLSPEGQAAMEKYGR